MLLSSQMPFYGKTRRSVAKKILSGYVVALAVIEDRESSAHRFLIVIRYFREFDLSTGSMTLQVRGGRMCQSKLKRS